MQNDMTCQHNSCVGHGVDPGGETNLLSTSILGQVGRSTVDNLSGFVSLASIVVARTLLVPDLPPLSPGLEELFRNLAGPDKVTSSPNVGVVVVPEGSAGSATTGCLWTWS